MMRAMVVGGGLTGCLSALQLADAGLSVSLYDQLDSLGGVLRDEIIDGRPYFSGCQYLAPRGAAYALLDGRVDCAFVDFPHAYGAWTKVGDRASYRDGVAQPVLEATIPSIEGDISDSATLAERFDLYGEAIAAILTGFAERWGHAPSTLHADCAQAMQMDRIMIEGSNDKVREKKSASALADALLGLPRAELFPDEPVQGALLPRDGFNALFRSLYATLVDLGVDIRLRSPVTVRTDGQPGGIGIFSRKQRLDYDLVVWCCNPVSLLHAAGVGTLDSPASRMMHLHCQATDADEGSPFYIQCYDAESPIYRIYSYAMGGRNCVCIECFDDTSDVMQILAQAELILQASGYSCALVLAGTRNVTNYLLFSPADHLAVAAFNRRAAGLRVVPGEWTTFGRDQKITSIGGSITALVDKLQ